MKFWHQQIAIAGLIILTKLLAWATDAPPFSLDGKMEVNSGFWLAWIRNLLNIVFLGRTLTWFAWDSKRGHWLVEAAGFSSDKLNRKYTGWFTRWWLHVDRNGVDLDDRS